MTRASADGHAHTDKYSQIYRILLPICITLSQLPTRHGSPALRAYIDAKYVGLARRAVPRDPWRLFPARVQRERRRQFLRRGELHRRTPHERVELVLVAREETVFPRVPAYLCVRIPAVRFVPLLTFMVGFNRFDGER